MNSEVQKILNLKIFFKLYNTTNLNKFNFKMPSILLMNNIYFSWLQSVFGKTHKNFTIYTNKRQCESEKKSLPNLYGFIHNDLYDYTEHTLVDLQTDGTFKKANELKLCLFVPQQDSLQYFIQWQRYRKFWWSSITTTPSLFQINEINYANDAADASVVAKFPWGSHTVENIKVNLNDSTSLLNSNVKNQKMSQLSCSISLETALLTLLLDGNMNNTKGEYLRLHRSIAPYKIAFALDYKDDSNKGRISELAKLLHHKLNQNKITSFLPDFTLSTGQQINENLQLGVVYTAVLGEHTLSIGILNLLSSSTMLKEQVHIADFDSYAELIFK